MVGETPNLAARLQSLAEPAMSSSPQGRATWSAISLSTAISALSTLRASPDLSEPGKC